MLRLKILMKQLKMKILKNIKETNLEEFSHYQKKFELNA